MTGTGLHTGLRCVGRCSPNPALDVEVWQCLPESSNTARTYSSVLLTYFALAPAFCSRARASFDSVYVTGDPPGRLGKWSPRLLGTPVDRQRYVVASIRPLPMQHGHMLVSSKLPGGEVREHGCGATEGDAGAAWLFRQINTSRLPQRWRRQTGSIRQRRCAGLQGRRPSLVGCLRTVGSVR